MATQNQDILNKKIWDTKTVVSIFMFLLGLAVSHFKHESEINIHKEKTESDITQLKKDKEELKNELGVFKVIFENSIENIKKQQVIDELAINGHNFQIENLQKNQNK